MAEKKKNAPKVRQPSTGDYLGALKDMFVVNPRNSPAATLGGAAYDYATRSTPQTVVRDIRSGVQGAEDWLRKQNKALRANPVTATLQMLKAGYIDPLADPYRVFKQAATERSRGNESGGAKLAAMVPLAVAGVLPQLRGAGNVAADVGVEAATKATVKGAAKATPPLKVTPKAKPASAMTVTPKASTPKAKTTSAEVRTSGAITRPDDKFRGEGTPRITVQKTEKPFVVRITGQSQIDDMIASGLVRPKEGGYGKQNSPQIYFGESDLALPTDIFGKPQPGRFVLAGKSGNLAGKEGPISIDDLEHIWEDVDGEIVDILPDVLRKNQEFVPTSAPEMTVTPFTATPPLKVTPKAKPASAMTVTPKEKRANPLAVGPKAKKKVAPVVKGIANPTQVVAEKYSPETARRTRDVVGSDAPVEQWLEVAGKLHGTQGNRPYQPESDLAFRDFDLGTYGMRKTIDAPRLFDLDVRRERYLPEAESNELVFQDIVNRPFMTGMADRTETATDITGLGPVDLDIPVREYGGQDYMKYNPFSWGVSTPTMGSNFMNTARRLKREFGVNPLWMPWRMQGSGSDFSKTTGEIMMSHANSTLGRDTRSAIDRFMKENYIPDFAGIDNPRGYEQFGEITGPQRKDMEKRFDATFAKEGALSQPLARAIITAPDQLNRKAFHLQNIAEIDPDAEIVVKAINPTYHQNTPGAYKGTLEPGLLESLNVAELIAPTLNEKYADLGDLSVFRGQNAPLTVENLARQRAEYEDLTRAFDVKLAAGNTKAKAPREPVPIGNVNKFMQSVFATGFLDDAAAQALYDKLVASGAQLK